MRRQMQHVDAIPVERMPVKRKLYGKLSAFTPITPFCARKAVKPVTTTASGSSIRWTAPATTCTDYLHGLPHFAVSIAQQIRGRTEHAVVYDPIREELFAASRGSGAYLNNKRMRVAPRKGLEGAILATAFPFRDRNHLQAYARVFQSVFAKVEDFRRAGTASLDLAWVAAGRLDGYFEIGMKPWDVAAGALIVREAGGVVMDFDGNDAVEESGTIIAAPYKVMTPLRQLIASKWKADQA